jgi:hypothetical protein
MGMALAQKNRLAEAQDSINRAIELSDEPLTLAVGALGYVHALSNNAVEARAIMDRLGSFSQVRYASDYAQAIVLAGLREHSKAIERLEKAFEQRYDRLIYLKVEPVFDALREEPKFRSLIRRMNL